MRTNYSPYFSSSFVHLENQMISKLGDLCQDFNDSPQILITNTETDIIKLWKNGMLQGVELIIHPNSGYDNFPVNFIKESRIPVLVGNPIRQEAVVNYCLSCLGDAASPPPWRKSWDAKRQWSRKPLWKQKALIIGHGHVGSSLKKKLEHILKEVYIHDPFQGLQGLDKKNLVDYVFVCASLNETTKMLVDNQFLLGLKDDITIINPARGSIICLDDLILFLKKNKKALAYLDVFPQEPRDIDKVKLVDNIKSTCHIAGVFEGIESEIINFEKRILSDFNKLKKQDFFKKYERINLVNRIQEGQII